MEVIATESELPCRCANCSKLSPRVTNVTLHGGERNLVLMQAEMFPEGWLFGSDPNGDTKNFCSKACFVQWVKGFD